MAFLELNHDMYDKFDLLTSIDLAHTDQSSEISKNTWYLMRRFSLGTRYPPNFVSLALIGD